MIIHYDIEQKSAEWYELRQLKLSASHAQAIAANGKGLITYINSKITDLINPTIKYCGKDMERGNEYEPLARIKYRLKTGIDIIEVGAVQYNDFILGSPDGVEIKDGIIKSIIEIKAKNDANHYEMLLGTKDFETSEEWQCYMNLLITGADYCDLISYNPNFKNSMVIKRVFPNKEKFDKLLKGFSSGQKLMNERLKNPKTIEELKEKGFKIAA